MIKLYTLSALLIIVNQIFAQWPARYNPANKVDQGRLVVVDANNNVYVTGRSQTKNGNDDYATIKFSASGQQLWVARYNGTGNGYDIPHGLAVDVNGNVYVTGSSFGAGTDYDFATVKYNSVGVQQWAKRYDGPTHTADAAKDVKVDAGGNVYVTGYADGATVNVSGNSVVTIKYNSSGDLQWDDRYDGVTTSEDANSLVLDGNGNVYITGESGGILTIKYKELAPNLVQREWIRNYPGDNGRKIEIRPDGNVVIGAWPYTTLKYDPAGNLIWSAIYDAPGSEGLWDMVLDASGNVYATGYSAGTDGSNDYLTVKYNSSGAEQWVARYSGADADRDHARAITVDNNGNAYVTGMTEPTNGSRTETRDYLTIKYNSATGAEEWSARYDAANSADDAFAIALDGLGNVYVTGQSATKQTNFDYATVRYSQNMTTRSAISDPLAENTNLLFGLQNYPNPFIHTTTIEYQIPRDGRVKLSIYDLQGKEVAVLVNGNKAAGTYKINFAADKLAAGTYVCRVQVGNMIETKKIIVTR